MLPQSLKSAAFGMRIVSPTEFYRTKESNDRPTIFLAGGISGTEDWQSGVEDYFDLKCPSLITFNPRCANFDIANPDDTRHQIMWEHRHLHAADAILFYFSPPTLCPITLFELGKMAMSGLPLFVCVHPEYSRRSDVHVQLQFIRPDIVVVFTLDELMAQVLAWVQDPKGNSISKL